MTLPVWKPMIRRACGAFLRTPAPGGRIAALAVAALLGASPFALAQRSGNGAEAVQSYTPGTGSGAGYGLEYYPANVLGLPDSTARADVATIDPRQVLGLGLGGEIVLRFENHPIIDGPGPDFTVFENAFYYVTSGSQRTYAEPGAISVSRDGVTFITFPFDSLTLKGCAGVTPTNGAADPANPAVSGGDSFDLAALGIDSVRYVKIHDVTAIVKGNTKHPFWDATLNGFDLDAVVAVSHDNPSSAPVAEAGNYKGSAAAIYPNPCITDATMRFTLGHPARVRVRLIDQLGREARTVADGPFDAGECRLKLDVAGLPPSPYLVAIDVDGRATATLRALVVR